MLKKNYQLAKAAKRYGVKRVIARFEDRNVKNSHEKELTSLGVEVITPSRLVLPCCAN